MARDGRPDDDPSAGFGLATAHTQLMRRLGPLLGAPFLFVVALVLVGSRRVARVAVSGHSMAPALLDGDWLVVDRYSKPAPRDVVVAWDPRARDRLIVKRVRAVGTDSQLLLESDHPAHAGNVIGPVAASAIVGRALFRYWPARRAGLVR